MRHPKGPFLLKTLCLVAHPCYTVSRIECRITFPQNQRCRAKIALHHPKSRCHTFLPDPLSHFPLIRSRQGAKGGCRGGLVEGIAPLLGSENGSRHREVSQLQSHQSRYPAMVLKIVEFYSTRSNLASVTIQCQFCRISSIFRPFGIFIVGSFG